MLAGRNVLCSKFFFHNLDLLNILFKTCFVLKSWNGRNEICFPYFEEYHIIAKLSSASRFTKSQAPSDLYTILSDLEAAT